MNNGQPYMPLYKVKVTVIGQYHVGKTSIASRFANGVFDNVYKATVGGSFMTRRITVHDRSFMFQLWDTAGSERYRALVPIYLRDTCAALVVYDVTDEQSFEQVPFWLEQLYKYSPQDVVIAVVGNKADMESDRRVSAETGEKFAAIGKYIFFETSAKTGENIEELFSALAEALRWRTRSSSSENKDTVTLSDDTDPKKSRHCSCRK